MTEETWEILGDRAKGELEALRDEKRGERDGMDI